MPDPVSVGAGGRKRSGARAAAPCAAESVAGAEIHEQRQAESGLRVLWTEAHNHSDDVTLGEALTFIDHIQLLNPAKRWQLLPAGDEVEIRFEFLLPYPQIAAERSSMVAIQAWGAVLGEFNIGGSDAANASHFLPVRKAELARTEPANSQLFYQIFGSGVCFSGAPGGINHLWLDAALLQHPLPAADVYLRDLLAARAQQLPSVVLPDRAGQMTTKTPLSLRVLALLEQNIHKFSQIQAVCAAVHLSHSTLFRRPKPNTPVLPNY